MVLSGRLRYGRRLFGCRLAGIDFNTAAGEKLRRSGQPGAEFQIGDGRSIDHSGKEQVVGSVGTQARGASCGGENPVLFEIA